jgi:hypothetical protein
MSKRRLNRLGVSGDCTVPGDDKALAGSGGVADGSLKGWACSMTTSFADGPVRKPLQHNRSHNP